MTVIRWPVTFLLLTSSVAHGNELDFEYLGQLPEYDVVAGEPVSYKFRNTNVDDDIAQASNGIGTGLRIFVDGQLERPDSGVFTSSLKLNSTIPDCVEDPNPEFSDWWACGNLEGEGDSQEYSFTWTPTDVGTYALEFRAICQELPIPPTGPRYCDEVVRSETTVVDPDTDGDGVGDPTDPDDDNDGITDDLDEQGLTPSNLCSFDDFDTALVFGEIVDHRTCAARRRINVGAQVLDIPAHLNLIAPLVVFHDGFEVLEGGRLTVISAHPCPGCGGYEIGDAGPADGIVFFVRGGGYHGLEAAPVDQSAGAEWGCYGTEIPGASNLGFGAGAQNTEAILEACVDSGIAARLAWDYSTNRFNDWFLPSYIEAIFMLNNLGPEGTGDIGDEPYWISTENGNAAALAVYYDEGHGTRGVISGRSTNHRVRAVREF